MKAILVIDETPKKCYGCRLMTDNMYCKGFAPYYAKDGTHITRMCVEDYVMHGDRHPNCPLKPMPQKENTFEKGLDEYGTGWRIGFNACIDEILGGNEQ